MTFAIRSMSTALLYAGLAGSIIGVGASWVAADRTCGGVFYVIAGLIALPFDVFAITSGSRWTATAAGLVKGAVLVVFPGTVLLICAPTVLEPIIPAWIGPTSLAAGVLATLAGGILRWFGR